MSAALIVDSLRPLDSRHAGSELAVIFRAVSAKVNPTVAIGAERNDVRGMIRAAITHATQVVRLKVCRAVWSFKGRICDTPLTGAFCARENISPDKATTAENVAHGLRWREHRLRSLHSPCSQGVEISADFLLFIVDDGRNSIERTELEYEGVPSISVAIRFLLNTMTGADVLALVSKHAVIGFREEQKAFSRCGMLGNGTVALVHRAGSAMMRDRRFSSPTATARGGCFGDSARKISRSALSSGRCATLLV